MAEAKIERGLQFDFVTPDEARQIIREEMSGYSREPQSMWPFESVSLNSSGNTFAGYTPTGSPAAIVPIYNPEVGYEASFHRIVVSVSNSATAYTFGNPYVNAAGYLQFYRAESRLADGISFASPGLPRVWTAGGSDGIRTVNGAPLSVMIVGGAGLASSTIQFDMQIFLKPFLSTFEQTQSARTSTAEI